MQGQTHKIGGIFCCVLGYSMLKERGMLIDGVNPLLQLAIMYPFAAYGAVMPDFDQNWHACPSKDPVAWCCNKVLHLTTTYRKKTGARDWLSGIFDAKHRSWQTHSVLMLLLMTYVAHQLLTQGLTSVDSVFIKLIFTGLSFGVISHMILDAITPEGIWLLIPSLLTKRKVMFHLVPKAKFFVTGGSWEKFIRGLLWVAIFVVVVWGIYKASPYQINF